MSYIVFTRELKFALPEGEIAMIPPYEPFIGEFLKEENNLSFLFVEELGGKIKIPSNSLMVLESVDQGDYESFDKPTTLFQLWNGLNEFVATEKSVVKLGDKPTYLGHYKATPEKTERVPVASWFKSKREAALAVIDELKQSKIDTVKEIDETTKVYETICKYIEIADEIIKEKE